MQAAGTGWCPAAARCGSRGDRAGARHGRPGGGSTSRELVLETAPGPVERRAGEARLAGDVLTPRAPPGGICPAPSRSTAARTWPGRRRRHREASSGASRIGARPPGSRTGVNSTQRRAMSSTGSPVGVRFPMSHIGRRTPAPAMGVCRRASAAGRRVRSARMLPSPSGPAGRPLRAAWGRPCPDSGPPPRLPANTVTGGCQVTSIEQVARVTVFGAM
jgi:hypothetical protein